MQTSFPASPKLVFLTSLPANHSLSWFAWRLLYKLINNNFVTHLLSTFNLRVGESTHMLTAQHQPERDIGDWQSNVV